MRGSLEPFTGSTRVVGSSKVECVALAGDLAHFSTTYNKWIPSLVELFLMRFYQLIDMLVSCAQGRLVKLTGDGFLATWELSGDYVELVECGEEPHRDENHSLLW